MGPFSPVRAYSLWVGLCPEKLVKQSQTFPNQHAETNHAEKYEGLIKVKFNSKRLKDERFGRFSKHRWMYALRRFRKLFKRWTLYDDRISDLSKPLKDERRGHKNHHELARQSEAKCKQAPQSEANVCRRRRKCNLKKTSLINCTGHPIMHRTPSTN